jgi:ABC-type polysaccharide/polyol phosphate export permease
MGLLFMILLLLVLLAALPTWPYSRTWGYYPSGFATMLLIVVILMIVFGALDFTYRAPAPPL